MPYNNFFAVPCCLQIIRTHSYVVVHTRTSTHTQRAVLLSFVCLLQQPLLTKSLKKALLLLLLIIIVFINQLPNSTA